ncbi:hypothetical protein Efla_000444 [Eimeria flavescens]
MRRPSSLLAVVAALALTTEPFQWTRAVKQWPGNSVFSTVFNAPLALVELQWGAEYLSVPGELFEGGFFDFDFASAIEGTVVEVAKEIDVEISAGNSCAAVNMGLPSAESERLLTVIEISDPNECQEMCRKTVKCKASLFNQKNATCMLLKGITGSIMRMAGTSVQLPSCESDCFHKGQKLTGGGTPLGTVPNASFCQALCAADSSCKGFTFRKSSQECLSFLDNTDMTADADAVSGSKAGCPSHVEATDYPGTCTIEDRTGANLPELATIQNVDTYEQCRKLCLLNPKCVFLTHNVPDRRCYLKPGMGDIVRIKAGDTTGPRMCDGSCFLKDIAMTGKALRRIQGSRSAHFCHFECSVDASCDLWTYGESTRECALYANSDDLTAKHLANHWTGPSPACAMEALYDLPGKPCALRGVKFSNGEPLEVTTQETPAKCQEACQKSDMCEAFAYDVQQKSCELFLANAENNREGSSNFVSGPRWCSASCIQQNKEFSGTSVGEFSSGFSTPEECQLRCQATTNCTHFTFRPKQSSCTLLSNATSKSVTGVTGGTKFCDGSCDLKHHALTRFGWNRNLMTVDAELCRSECIKDPNCSAFTFSDRCYLFDEFSFVKLHPATNVIATGWETCSNCFREGVGYKVDGNALWSTDAQNAEECRQRCSFMENCTRFTYNAKSKVCSMLSGETEDEAGSNLISGPARCTRDRSCIVSDKIFTGGVIGLRRSLAKSEECQDLCEKTSGCQVYNHNSSTRACDLYGGDNLSYKVNNGWTSGKKKCVSYGQELCLDPNMDYSYSDLYRSAIGCTTGTCCRDACVSEPRCKVFLWEPKLNQCWPKLIKAYTNRGSRANVSSTGRTGCPYCARWRRQYNGTVVGTKEVATQAQCQEGRVLQPAGCINAHCLLFFTAEALEVSYQRSLLAD